MVLCYWCKPGVLRLLFSFRVCDKHKYIEEIGNTSWQSLSDMLDSKHPKVEEWINASRIDDSPVPELQIARALLNLVPKK